MKIVQAFCGMVLAYVALICLKLMVWHKPNLKHPLGHSVIMLVFALALGFGAYALLAPVFGPKRD